MAQVAFVASVDEQHIDKMDKIVHSLKKSGFSVDTVRKLTGTISGSTDSIASIRKAKITGVTIEPERIYSIQ